MTVARGDGSDVVAIRVFDGTGKGGLYLDAMQSSAVRGGPFDPDLTTGGRNNGYTVNGVGWYRKTFDGAGVPLGKRVAIRFDGVYMHSQVWINGTRLGAHPYGYTPFTFDVTSHLRRDGKNVVAVRVDASGDPRRWYHGSGIWRHVWLIVTGEVAHAHSLSFASSSPTIVIPRLMAVNRAPRQPGVPHRGVAEDGEIALEGGNHDVLVVGRRARRSSRTFAR